MRGVPQEGQNFMSTAESGHSAPAGAYGHFELYVGARRLSRNRTVDLSNGLTVRPLYALNSARRRTGVARDVTAGSSVASGARAPP